MKALRHGAALAALLAGTACALPGAGRVGPQPDEIIQPRGMDAAPAGPEPSPVVSGLPVSPQPDGLLPVAGYLAVLVLLLAGAWVLLRRGSLPRPFSKNDGKLRVLETRLLGNRQFLVVVEYDGAKMLLGVCPGRIDYLTPLAGHPLAAAASGDEDEPAPPPPAVSRR
jgi:flagellar biosynthetic protein FliO